MAYKKGETGNAKGRPKGIPNKLTQTVKDVFAQVFSELQEHPTANLKTWAESNESEFYKLASKMIPTQLQGELTGANGKPLFPSVGVVVDAMKGKE